MRAVSNLQKESEAGAVIQATSTMLKEHSTPAGKTRCGLQKIQTFRQKQENSDDQQVQNVYCHLVQEKEASWMKIFFPA